MPKKDPPPGFLKSVKASASSTLTNPLTCGAKDQALYHSWMLVDFHIWHRAALLLRDLCPSSSRHQIVAAYGGHEDDPGAQLCNIIRNQPTAVMLHTFNCRCCPNKAKNWKSQSAESNARSFTPSVRRVCCDFYHLSYLCSFLHLLTVFPRLTLSLQCYSAGR